MPAYTPPSTTTTADGDHAFDLVGGDTLTLNSGIDLMANGAGANGINSSGVGNDLSIAGLVSAAQGIGVSLLGQSTVNIAMTGYVSSGQVGLSMAGDRNSLTNLGSIVGAGTGVKIGSPNSIGLTIKNVGSIKGTGGEGLTIFGDAVVSNFGLIEGTTQAIQVAGFAKSAVIHNFGTIVGSSGIAITLANATNATVINSGKIEGQITLNSKDDIYDGRSGVATGLIFFEDGNDIGYGGAGEETFEGGAGNDRIDGGGGYNTAVFSGTRASYDISDANGTVTVIDKRAGQDGTDTLKNIRFAKFTDQTVTLTNAAPINLALSRTVFAEDTPVTGVVASLAAFDADGDALSYSLTSNPSGLFRLDGANLVLAGAADFEALSRHSVTVTAKDAYGGAATKTFDLAVTNVIETTPLTLRGTRGADRLSGESGSDKFYGGLSNDILTGGAGRDIFVFDTRPNKRTNLDKITDFSVRDDTVHLAKSAFSKISKKGVLSNSAFYAGSAAHDATDRVIYNKKTGALFYDQDGNGAKAAIQFATVSKNLKMTAHDFYVL
jgi:Ca2+-binding RTX toxin-like protein